MLWFYWDRYDRKDPSVVAISLSPEGSLLLGFFGSCILPKHLWYSDNLWGVHSIDFSKVRDDKCHVGVGQSRVRNIQPAHDLLTKSPAGEVDQVDHLLGGGVHLQRWPVYRHGAAVRFYWIRKVPKTMKSLCAAFRITSVSPAVTKLPTVSTNQTKTIANCSPWRWELIYFCLLTPSTQDNYNKKIAPFSFDKVLKAVVPVNINVSLSVIAILKIKEVDHIYILKFCLVLEWYTKFL